MEAMEIPFETAVPRLLKICQVAEALAISRTSAYRLAASGQLPTVRFGGTVRVLPDDLAAFITANRSNGAAGAHEPGDGQ